MQKARPQVHVGITTLKLIIFVSDSPNVMLAKFSRYAVSTGPLINMCDAESFVYIYVGPLWLAASLTFALCGALSKETGLTVVGVCVVYEYFIIRQVSGHRVNHGVL